MEEEKAVRNYCRIMIDRIRTKQQKTDCSGEGKRRHKHKEGRERERTEPKRQGDEFRSRTECDLPRQDRIKWGGRQTSLPVTCQVLDVRPVPVQLLSMLKLKTFKEDIKRAAEVELHDPTACVVCQQENASLALKSFIRRKKTQLQFQTLKARLNTHLWSDVT